MQNFNFDNIIFEGLGDIYQCVDNGAPERPVEGDWNYPDNPMTLYRWDYRNAIVVSMSINNYNPKPIKVTVSINKYDDDLTTLLDTAPIIYNITVPAGATFVPIGEMHKVILEYGDALNISFTGAVSNDDVKSNVSIMNIYDYGHIPPIWTPAPWFGQLGTFGPGESTTYDRSYNKIFFETDTFASAYNVLVGDYYNKACASDNVSSHVNGGYSSYSSIQTITYSTWAVNTSWGTMHEGTGRHVAASDTYTMLMAGGYPSLNLIQYIEFANNANKGAWSTLYENTGKEKMCSVNSRTYALFMGGSGGDSATIQYVEFATQAQAQYWGDLYFYTHPDGGGASNETYGLTFGGYYTTSDSYKHVHKHDLAAQSNSYDWGKIDTYYCMYDCGAVGSGEKVLFGGDEYYTDDLYEVFFDTEATTSHWGTVYDYDGGQPCGASGS